MRVCFVNRYCHPDHSATSQILSDLAAGLVEKGWSVTMVASRQRYDDPGEVLAAREFWRGVEIHRIWTTRFGRARLLGRAIDYLTFYLSLPWHLLRLLRPGDVVVAKTDPPLVSLVVAPVARFRDARLVNWLQDVFPEVAVSLGEPPLPAPLAWLLRKLRNASLRVASMNVVIGARMAEHFVSEGLPEDRVQVISNWAHEDSIQPKAAADSELRRELGLLDKFVVAYSGNLGRAHEIDTLFAAVCRLEDDPRIAFVVSGGGHGYVQLQQRSQAARLRNIQFLPYQPMAKLSDSLAAGDVHLVSLRPMLEGLIVPSKFYGIAAAGRAIGFIGDPDGELARLITLNQCGFCVAPGRDDLLAEAIIRLASDPGSAREQGLRARKLLDSTFSREAAHRQWNKLLAGLDANPKHDLRENKES